MLDRRRLATLPRADLGWLKARHHFPVDGRPDPDQIWIEPRRAGGRPEYATRRFPSRERNAFSVLSTGLEEDAGTDALPLRADARLVAGVLEAGRSLSWKLATGRSAYLVPASGKVLVNGVEVEEGDGVAVTDEARIELIALRDAEVVAVELA